MKKTRKKLMGKCSKCGRPLVKSGVCHDCAGKKGMAVAIKGRKVVADGDSDGN